MSAETKQAPVLLERRGRVAVITLNRPDVANAQDSAMLYALDDAFYEFAQDDDLGVAILRGAGKHFSSGHDIGPGGMADYEVRYPRRSMWWDHVGKVGADNWLSRESEVYLGFCRRWHELPKPTIAMVHGSCVAAGLMLAWSCDLIVASEDASFADPVIRMGAPGVEYFRHPWEMGSRQAKEFLFMGQRITAARAYELGMLNHVWPADELETRTMEMATTISERSRFALALAKMAVNRAEDAMGQQVGIDSVFGLHHLAHVQNVLESNSPNRGLTSDKTRDAMRADERPADRRGDRGR
jgi:enoyl-CoA hydratase